MVLTTDGALEFRILGKTRSQKVLNRSTFIITGNQLVISGDLPRRCLFCRLDPDTEAPEMRTFAFDPVTRALAMFPELGMAALTAARYYLQAKCPQPKYARGIAAESGSFTEWNRIVRGMLVHLGFGDPLTTQKEIKAENPMLQNDVELARALRKLFHRGDRFSASAVRNAPGSDAFTLLAGPDMKWDSQRVGYRLRNLRDRVLDGLKVEVAGHAHGVSFYRVTDLRKGGVG